MFCYFADKSCDHKHCDGRDITFSICHMTSCEHIFKALREFIGESSSPLVTILRCFVPIGLMQVEIYTI